jgi:hypothetical protein
LGKVANDFKKRRGGGEGGGRATGGWDEYQKINSGVRKMADGVKGGGPEVAAEALMTSPDAGDGHGKERYFRPLLLSHLA